MNMRILTTLAGALLLLVACGPGDGSGVDAGATSSSNDASANGASVESSAANVVDSRVRLEVQGEPTVGPATVVVYLLEDGDGVSGAQVEVTGDMTHAGMMPVITDAPEAEPGLYRTEDFRFTMGGDWILTAEITLPDGTAATTTTTLTVPAD